MNNIIKIIPSEQNNFNPVEGNCTYDLLNKLDKLDNDEKATLINVTKNPPGFRNSIPWVYIPLTRPQYSSPLVNPILFGCS